MPQASPTACPPQADDDTGLPPAQPHAGRQPAATGHQRRELLTWRRADTDRPDSDITVLCWDGETPFFCGYWDDAMQGWIDCESGGSVLGVTHWAEPTGPQL